MGLELENIKTAAFKGNTNFEWINKRNVFKGYKATHNLNVEFLFEKDYLNRVLRVLSRTRSAATFRVLFKVKDPDPLRQRALAEAVHNSRVKALVMAEAAGVKLGELLQVDYSWVEMHIQSRTDMDLMAESAPGYSLSPEDVEVSESVTVV